METEPITDTDEILDQLQSVDVGDELTIEDEGGYMDNREVTDVSGAFFTFGDPIKQKRVVNIGKGTVHRITDDPDNPFSAGNDITKLWVWDA